MERLPVTVRLSETVTVPEAELRNILSWVDWMVLPLRERLPTVRRSVTTLSGLMVVVIEEPEKTRGGGMAATLWLRSLILRFSESMDCWILVRSPISDILMSPDTISLANSLSAMASASLN